ncbi:MAG TPA: mannan-binding lectin [Thermoanaerobaculia bacterium]|jgi:hypothetical protein
MKRMILVVVLLSIVVAAHAALAANVCTVNAGPIWNQQDANQKCPATCNNGYGPWTGQWWTTVQGQMSVCQCGANNKSFDAGPIWNQPDANKKCPTVCKTASGTWTGQWWTTVPGKMSVCQCAVCTPETAPAKP